MAIEESGSGDADRPVVGARSVDIVVSLLILAVALVLGWDSWRIGNSWASDGPQAGYFPFYLAVLMGLASLFGLGKTLFTAHLAGEAFVTREPFVRVMQVFVPTLAFCIATQFLGLYVASFCLVAGFMWWVGKIAAWISLTTGFVFTAVMFLTFEIAFNVIMPKGPLEAAFGY
jgi:putative tricarboxylic transport membrane protein